MKNITKIVVTGGPCAGKTTGMSWIQRAFAEKGYAVLFVPETATELISGGVAPWTCRTNEDFQECLFRLQLEKERLFEISAQGMKSDKVLIVCDRGLIDNKAYMNDDEFGSVLNRINSNEVELRDSYDAVFHLVTAAKGAAQFYTTENNSARTETPEQASLIDDKLIAAWTGHPHFRMIDNSTDFEGKMRKLIAEIASFLGEPEPLEIERKYLIGYPDIAALESLPNCEQVDIIQTYLVSDNGDEVRVRQRGKNGYYIYFRTTKKRIDGLQRIEIEKRLTQKEYLECLMYADTARTPVRKKRYCLSLDGRYYEIDVFPFWNDRAILEIELADIDEEVKIPDMFTVIREVTEDENYSNSSLAKIKK